MIKRLKRILGGISIAALLTFTVLSVYFPDFIEEAKAQAISTFVALTGAGSATGDLFVVVDISEAALADRTKNITRDELRIAMGVGPNQIDFTEIVDDMTLDGDLSIAVPAVNNITIDSRIAPSTHTQGIMRYEHTAGAVNTRVIELEVDAADFASTHAVRADLHATALAPGEAMIGYHVSADKSTSTGGVIEAFRVDGAGAGSAGVHALHVNPGVDVIHHEAGVFGAIESAWENAVEVTSELNDAGTDLTLFSSNSDILYIGDAAAFNEIRVNLNTAAGGAGIKPTFEFSDDGIGGWEPFTPVDGSDGFRETGIIDWLIGDLTNWQTDTVNGVANKFWIRIIRTQPSIPVDPIEDTIQILKATEFGWSEDGVLDVANINVNNTTSAGFAISNWDFTQTSTAYTAGLYVLTSINPSSDSDQRHFGFISDIDMEGASSNVTGTGGLIAIEGAAYADTGSSVSNLWGVRALVSEYNPSTATNAYAFYAFSSDVTTLTNNYGLYLTDFSSGASAINEAIHVDGGDINFASSNMDVAQVARANLLDTGIVTQTLTGTGNQTIDLESGNSVKHVAFGAITWTFSNPPAQPALGRIDLSLVGGGIGAQTFTNVIWENGSPPVLLDTQQDFTTDFGTDDKLDITAHGFIAGERVHATTTGVLPAGLNAAIVLYVVNPTNDDFEVSLTLGGSAVDIADDGTGTHTIHSGENRLIFTTDVGGIYWVGRAPVSTGITMADGAQILLDVGSPSAPSIADAAEPTKKGIFFTGADATGRILFSINGAAMFKVANAEFSASGLDGPGLRRSVSTSTNPTILPKLSDLDSGLVSAGDDQSGIAAGGVSAVVWEEASSQILVKNSVHAGLTANAGGGGVGSCLQILSSFNVFTVVGTAGDSGCLPTAVAGYEVFIVNNDSTDAMDVFPFTDDNLGAGVNNAASLAAGANIRYFAIDGVNWEVM